MSMSQPLSTLPCPTPPRVIRCSPVSIDRLLAFAATTDRTLLVRLPGDKLPSRQADRIEEILDAVRQGALRDLDENDGQMQSPRLRLAALRDELFVGRREIAAAVVSTDGHEGSDLLVLAFPHYPSGAVVIDLDEAR